MSRLEELRPGGAATGVVWGQGQRLSGALGVSLKATEKESCSNAGSWGRDQGTEQSEGTRQDQKANREVQWEWMARGRAGQASRDTARWTVVPREGHVLLELSGRARERHTYSHLLHFGALPPTRVHVWEGWGAQRKQQRQHTARDWRLGTLMMAAT